MDISKWTYIKEDSTRQPLMQNRSQEPITNEEVVVNIPNIPQTYTKLEGVLSTNLIFVISGGEKREKDFLRELIRQQTIHSLRVAFISEKGQGLQPKQMYERLKQIQSHGYCKINDQVYNLELSDKVFLLTDVDEYYSQLQSIFVETHPCDNVSWIVSNPCFEIWLYYCFRNDPKSDLNILATEHTSKRSQKLKALGQKIIPGGLNPCIAFERMAEGIKNSRVHFAIDKYGIPVLFATQMHQMAQYLVDTMNKSNNEYAEYVSRKEAIRNWYRSR